jgi:hypothetical protein
MASLLKNSYQGRNIVSTQIPWDVIESITHGRIGRTMATCPLCSEGRRTPQKRHSKVLAVTLIEPEFAVYYCNHCEAQGYCRPDTPSRVIDLADDFGQHGIEALKIAWLTDRM